MGTVYDRKLSLEEQCKAFEKSIIEQSLEREGYSFDDKKRVAKQLGIGEATLYRKLKALGIETKGRR